MSKRKKPTDPPAPLDGTTHETYPEEATRISGHELKHLLARCLHKDEKAWETLFSSLYGLVKDVVLRVGLKDEDVDDAIAESFFRIVSFIQDVAASRNPLPYIGALVRYTALGVKQRQERHTTRSLGPLDSEDSSLLASWDRGDPPKQGVTMMAAQVNEGIAEALEQLKPEERRLIRLKYTLDLCYEEIAYIIGKAPGTARVATFRAVHKLKELVQPQIRDMVNDSHDLWNRIAALQIEDVSDPSLDERIQHLLEDFVADKDSMTPSDRKEIETLLARSSPLRERKVLLDRASFLDQDVTGHLAPQRIPPALLRRLMEEVRSIRF